MMRHSSKRPINSVKNIVDGVFLGVTAASVTTVTLAEGVNDYTGGTTQVPVGGTVSSFYLFVQIIASATGTANVDWYLIKNIAGQLTLPVPGATGGTPVRSKILHEEKGIPGNASDGAYPLTFKGVIKIPPGMRRMAEADKFELRIRGADAYNACVKCIYKFYK